MKAVFRLKIRNFFGIILFDYDQFKFGDGREKGSICKKG